MSPTDPIQAAHEAKHATTLLRESRAIQRRLDKLAGLPLRHESDQ